MGVAGQLLTIACSLGLLHQNTPDNSPETVSMHPDCLIFLWLSLCTALHCCAQMTTCRQPWIGHSALMLPKPICHNRESHQIIMCLVAANSRLSISPVCVLSRRWNAPTLGDYWKLWNMPVHKWLLRHVYFPALRLGFSR